MKLAAGMCLIAVALAQPACAEELSILGGHALQGKQGEDPFTGTLEIAADATFRGERRFASGKKDAVSGRVSIDESSLVLQGDAGIAGTLAGAARPAPRRYGRADKDGRIVWRHEAGAFVEEIVATKKEARVDAFVRALGKGRIANWLFNDNRGFVDADPEHRIRRSEQPMPEDLVELVARKRVKTIVSLNGDLDKTVVWYRDGEPGEPRIAEKVNLKKFITERGIAHETFGLGSSSAPTDAQLVGIFRVLLDDAKKPILLHCLGGADRTGIITALYQVEFLGVSKAEAKKTMRDHFWAAANGTEIQGAYLDLYQPGRLRELLAKAGVELPARFKRPVATRSP